MLGKISIPCKMRIQVLSNPVVYPPLALVRGAVKVYIVDVQYFQVLPFLYSNFFDHKSHIKKITLLVPEGFNIRIGICTLFLKGEEMGVGW